MTSVKSEIIIKETLPLYRTRIVIKIEQKAKEYGYSLSHVLTKFIENLSAKIKVRE